MSTRTARSGALAAAAAAATALIAAPWASAATPNATWAGAAGSPLWSDAGADGANWLGGTPPGTPIGTLAFPDLPSCDVGTPATSCYTSEDDLGPTTVGQITIGGGREYQIYAAASASPGESITLEGSHPGAPPARNVGLLAAPTGANLQLADLSVPIVLGHDQTWEVRRYGILYLNSVGGMHALRLRLNNGWVQANNVQTGPITISGPGELQLDQAAGSPASLPNVTVNDSTGKASGLGISATNATTGSIHISGTDNKFIVLTDNAPGETLLHVNGNVTLDHTTTAEFEIDGNDTTPGHESSQLATPDTVNFRGADISLWQEHDAGNCDALTPGNTYTLLRGARLTGRIRVGDKLISRGHSASETFQSNVCKHARSTSVVLRYRARSLTATIRGRVRTHPLLRSVYACGVNATEPSPRSAETRLTFPGDDLVSSGLADLAAGRKTVEALLLAAAEPRLQRAGVRLPAHRMDRSGRELYALLEAELGTRAHARYNALQRRVIAYCSARTQDARRR